MNKRKHKALILRRSGKSYNEIFRELGVPKSTLSSWFRKVDWPQNFLEKLWNKNRRTWASNITRFNKERARIIIERHKKERSKYARLLGRISKRELLLVGCALYWAEGAKNDRWKILFVNSDPNMIRLMMYFFRNIQKIPEERIKISVQIHPNISDQKAKIYWSGITLIPAKSFDKTLLQVSSASKGKRKKRTLPYGTCRISINGVNEVNKLMGWIQGVAEQCKSVSKHYRN